MDATKPRAGEKSATRLTNIYPVVHPPNAHYLHEKERRPEAHFSYDHELLSVIKACYVHAMLTVDVHFIGWLSRNAPLVIASYPTPARIIIKPKSTDKK